MKAFLSYSHKDKWALERLHTHLAQLQREEKISAWYDREILAGSDVDIEIDQRLSDCNLFIALISADFLSSDYCYNTEMNTAIQRHEEGSLRIVPLIVTPCDWLSSPISKFKAVPLDGKPITEWRNQDSAFLDIITELRRLVSPNQETTGSKPESTNLTNNHERKSRYKVERTFDEIDIAAFRESAFAVFKRYFEEAISEVGMIDGIRSHFADGGPSNFSCIIVNNMNQHGTAHINVRTKTHSQFFGDISYSFSDRPDPNSSSGEFAIESDGFNLYLKAGLQVFSDSNEKLTPETAAESLWSDFMNQAGVYHD